MKTFYLILLMLVLVLQISIEAQNYGLDERSTDIFQRYKIPYTKLHSFNIGANFDFNSQNNINNYPTSSFHEFSSRLSGSLAPAYYYLRESDDRQLSLNSTISGSLSRNFNRNSNPYENTQENKHLLISNLFSLKNYYKEGEDLFYSISSLINVQMNESIYKRKQNEQPDYRSYSSDKQQNYEVSLGWGLGRKRNVTHVISALRFQKRLKQLNLIENDFDDNTITLLAQQFSRYNSYSDIYIRTPKYFWDDLFKVLDNTNINAGDLNPYAINYLQEVPNEIRFLRNEGYFIQAILSVNYYNTFNVSDYENQPGYPVRQSGYYEGLYILPGISFSYSHQLNLNSQLYVGIIIKGGPNITTPQNVKQQYSANLNLGYNNELTDRLVFSFDNTLEYNTINTNLVQKNLNFNSSTSFIYFIEDNISLNFNYEFNAYKFDYSSFIQKTNRTTNNIHFGITYYFDKGIAIY